MKRFSIGIVGLGQVSNFHLYALNRLADWYNFIGAYDIDRTNSQQVAPGYFFSSLKNLLSKKPDCIAVTSPGKTRYAICRQILESGVNIFVEKPIVLSLSKLLQLQKLAQKNKLLIHGAFHAQFSSTVIWLANQLIVSPKDTVHLEYGKLKSAILNRFDPYLVDPKKTAPELSSGIDSLPNILSELSRYVSNFSSLKFETLDKTHSPQYLEVKATCTGNFPGGTFTAHTDWTKNINLKETTLHFEKSTIYLNHSEQKSITEVNGRTTSTISFANLGERLPLEYYRAYIDLYEVLIGNRNNNHDLLLSTTKVIDQLVRSL